MSLTSFLDLPDAKAAMRPLRPETRRQIDVPLRVEPRSNRYDMIGTAFDYLLRFELQRRAPHVVTERWVAEHGCNMLFHEIWREGKRVGAAGWDLLKGTVDPKDYLPPDEVAERARAIVER